MNEVWDVVVIGAGAAGLMAASRAAERGRRTLLLEKNARPGVKILMSGGTRCNITHATDRRGIVTAFGRQQGPFLHSALAALGPNELIRLIEDEGVATKVEPTGKIFPVSDDAADVLGALVRRLDRSGAALALDEPLLSIERSAADPSGVEERVVANSEGESPSLIAARFTLVTPKRRISAASVILTTGGKSYPGSGTTGDGYAWAAALGHTIVEPRPALAPITTHAEWVRELQGITIEDVAVQVVDGPARLDERRGSLLFAHFGLSGPVALDASRAVSLSPHPQRLDLICDFLPAMRRDEFDAALRDQASRDGRRTVAALVAAWLPRRLAESLAAQAGIPAEQRSSELSKKQRADFADRIKAARIPVSGTMGFRKAEVTAGGVSRDEVDSRTMQSKLVPGLYFAGEILDLDGPIGGYNFQAAFSTGWLAGDRAP